MLRFLEVAIMISRKGRGGTFRLTAQLQSREVVMAGSEGEVPQARPGERLGLFKITTIPPGLMLRILTEITAATSDPNRVVRQIAEPQIGPSPQNVPVSFAPDAVAQVVVRAFLQDPVPPGSEVTLAVEVEVDGQPLVGAEDVVGIDERNQQTAFALSVLHTRMAPPPDAV